MRKFQSAYEAFDITSGDVVSLIGGGGKTTLMFRLLDELSDLGMKVIATTTTKLELPVVETAGNLAIERKKDILFKKITKGLKESNYLIVARETIFDQDEEKLKGIDPEVVDELGNEQVADIILVEADGAKHKSLKVHDEHEPMIPGSSTLCIAVVGVDVIGKKLSEENVHRAERFAEIVSTEIGAEITVNQVSALFGHPLGYLKGVPATSRIVPFISRVKSEEDRKVGLSLISCFKGSNRFPNVVLGDIDAKQNQCSLSVHGLGLIS